MVATSRQQDSAGFSEAEIKGGQEMSRELSIMKMQNDSIFSMARTHPRSQSQILEHIRDQLRTYKDFCEEAVYHKPVGKDDSGRMKYADGLSIRAAEALAEAYGYNMTTSWSEPIDEFNARVGASFTNYQTGRVWSSSGVVSRRYKMRGGGTGLIPEDRFWDVVVKAAASKQIRECILRTIPPGLQSALQKEAEEQLQAFLTPEAIKRILEQFASKGVTVEMLEKWAGKKMKDFDRLDRVQLVGIWTAVKDGETTIAQAFGDDKPEAQSLSDRLRAGKSNGKPANTEPQDATPAQSAPEPEPSRGTLEAGPGAEVSEPVEVALKDINGLGVGAAFVVTAAMKRVDPERSKVTLWQGTLVKEFDYDGPLDDSWRENVAVKVRGTVTGPKKARIETIEVAG